MCTSFAHLHGHAIYGILQHEFFTHSSIRVHHGKTQVWNRGALRCCRQWPQSTTQMRQCGEAIPLCAGRTKACGFWAHHWDTQTLFVASCLRCVRHMTSLSRRSGDASATFLGLLLPAFTGIWPVCHCVWAALGSAVQHWSQDPLSGQAGHTVWR